jgi:hypothetical protein
MRAALNAMMALGLTSSAWAQQGPPLLGGTIQDQTGALIANGTISIENKLGFRQITRTDERGEFRFTDLLPGAYTLELRVDGFYRVALDIELERGVQR